MPLVRVHRLTNTAPTNTNWQITVSNGNYACGSTVQQFDLSSAAVGVGRLAIVRVLKSAGSITGYAGAAVTPPSGLTVYSVSHEDVSYGGVAYDCIVVTLISTTPQPANVTSGDWIITVSGTYTCGSTAQKIDLSSATLLAGRWVAIKATTISGFTTANVTPPAGLTVAGVTQENVLFGAVTWQCLVVTLA